MTCFVVQLLIPHEVIGLFGVGFAKEVLASGKAKLPMRAQEMRISEARIP
jgi:hypothetical protein